RCASAKEFLDDLLQFFISRVVAQRIAPDLFGLALAAFRPEYFAQMRGDLRVRTLIECTLQILQAFGMIAEAIVHPAHAVENERVLGRKLERLLDVAARLREPIGAI